MLKPALDATLKPSGIITMSDDRTNGHWLIAEQDRSFTFEVSLVDLSKARTYALRANNYNMIFVDPTATECQWPHPRKGDDLRRVQIEVRALTCPTTG